MIEAMVDDLIIDVPGCPMVTIRDALSWAQGQLCDLGNAWRTELTVTVEDGTATIALDPAINADPIRVMAIYQGGRQLASSRYSQISPSRVLANIHGEARMTVAIKPKRGQSLPEELLNQYGEALRCGTRWRLLIMPQAWRDPAAADFYRREFYEHVSQAKEASWSGLQAGSRRMRTP